MKYPNFLKEKGIIGLVSPSFGCSTEPYKSRLIAAISFFEKENYLLIKGDNIFSGFNPSLEESMIKANEINNFFQNESDIIISVGGGELMNQIIDYIDFEVIKNNPKWFVGYSDNTNLLFLLTTICDIACIYGPHAGDFSLQPRHQSIDDTLSLLKGEKLEFTSYPKWEIDQSKQENPLASWRLTENTIITNYPSNKLSFEGRIIGGCLDILNHLVGTKFDHVESFIDKYSSDGIIWFLEACDLDVLSIRRALLHLKRANWFKNVKGFVFGRPKTAFNQEIFGLNRFNAVTDILSDLNVPIVFDVNFGHLKPSTPIILGSYGKIESYDNNLIINMELKK